MICQIGDAKIYYEEVGNGKPILMIHGFSLDHKVMAGCMEPLFQKETGYKRIYMDLPGMGKSNAPESVGNTDQMLDIVISFIQRTIPDKNFLLAGQSYGGYLARGVVYRLKERVDGMCLICPVVIADKELRNVPAHIMLIRNMDILSSLTMDEAKEFNWSPVIANGYTWKRCKNEVFPGLKIADKSFIERIEQNYSYSFDVDEKSRAEFEKPVLLLSGHQDDCVGYQDLWRIVGNYPRATFATLDVAGHSLQIEQPELFNNLVRNWLERVEIDSKHKLE